MKRKLKHYSYLISFNSLLIVVLLLTGVLLMLSLSIVSVTPTFAASIENVNTIQPLLVEISAARASGSVSNNVFKAKTTVTTLNKTTISVTMKLQKKSGTSWITVKTWNKTQTGSNYLLYTEEHTVSSGTYRVYSEITAGADSITRTSSTITN